MDDGATDREGDEDGHDDPDRETDDPDAGTGGTGDPPAWAELFERAAAYRTDETAVREALSRRRGLADD
jgi:hypothetical protein